MSIKKLFEDSRKTKNFLAETTKKTSFDDAESSENIVQKQADYERYVPQIDYSDPVNFAKYGSARLYYESAFTRILDFYPYDGSAAEINKFHNESLDIEKYIFDNKYPRTTGFITLGRDGYSVSSVSNDGYGVPTTSEYIDFKGGPGTGSATSLNLKDLLPNPNNSSYKSSNLYDESVYQTEGLPSDYGSGTRTSNLRANFDDGVTVEFWLKTGSFTEALTQKQVVFDMWNQNATTADDYGRITIELTGSSDAETGITKTQRPFLLTVQSGASTVKNYLSLGSSSIHDTMGDWNHYAITMHNSASNFITHLYVNGRLSDTANRVAYDLSTSTPHAARAWPRAIDAHYSSSANLQGWWRFNKNDTAGLLDMTDSSGNGNDGTSVDFIPTLNTTHYPSKYVQSGEASAQWDGTNDRVVIGSAELWNGLIGNDPYKPSTQQMTLAAWVRKTAADATPAESIIFDFGLADIRLFVNNDEKIIFSARWGPETVTGDTGELVQWKTSTGAIDINAWYHIALTYDVSSPSNAPILYVNGQVKNWEVEGTPTGVFDGIRITDCYIGGNNSETSRRWEGQLADCAIWNSILSEDEIQSIYSAVTLTSTTYTVGELEPKETIGRIGALQTSPVGSDTPAGAGRLSGSMDEFRYWKVKRTGKQIGRNWNDQVRGGANTDVSNTTLGVYYKFNEGITGDSAIDSIILDYAGRATNGSWTGYSSEARHTGSAIVSSSAATKEFLDPIIRPSHPDVELLKSELITSGTSHDYNNNASLISLVPGWIQDEEAENENSDLRYIAHIMGAYFDKLYLQISDLPKLRHLNYVSSSHKPVHFAHHLPQSLGLYSPELFIESTVLEKFVDRNDEMLFEDSLNNTKNLIYQNLYNNLVNIFKSKGTEQSIRNVFRCFNIADNVLSVNINTNNEEFLLKNNLKLNLLKKNVIDFSHPDNTRGVIYQASSSLDGMNNADASGSINGFPEQFPYGFTYESRIIFPDYTKHMSRLTRDKTFNQVSLFGMVTVDKTSITKKTGADTSFESAADDVCNFRVYAIRESEGSKNAYFKLTSSFPEAELPSGVDIAGINLTSSVFHNVYDDEPWHFSIRVKPKNYPRSYLILTGSDSATATSPVETYDVIFTGINPKTADIRDVFTLSQSIPNSTGKAMIAARKRVFVGADRTNFIGDVQYKSDIQASSLSYWGKYLSDHDITQHAVDFENIGISDGHESLSVLDGVGSGDYHFLDILNKNALALNWNFRNVTGSGNHGGFVVQDFSSGSSEIRNNFGWLGSLSGFQYTGAGYGFKTSSLEVANKKSINTYKFINPERVVSSDMIQLFSEEDEFFPNLKREEFVPNHVYTIEKSIYNAVTEEMLDFMAGVNDFHSLIGDPVNKYRERYKQMEKLRETFFRRVNKVTDVEKYMSYYKWFDDAVTSIIAQLVPASAEYIDDVQNIVESHVLERNKYKFRIPIIKQDEAAFDDLKASLKGKTPDGYSDYDPDDRPAGPKKLTGGADFDPLDIKDELKEEKDNRVIYDADGTVFVAPRGFLETDRDKSTDASVMGAAFVADAGHKRDSPLDPVAAIKGGVNFTPSKNLNFSQTRLRPAGPVDTTDNVFVPLNVMVGFTAESVVPRNTTPVAQPSEYITKDMKVFHVQQGKDWELGIGYKNVKSTMVLPFNVVSSNVEVNTGYNKQVIDKVDRNLQITNLHNDTYGSELEIPMQGPFTSYAVGGHQSRHISLNDGTDTELTRPEAWRIRLGTCADLREGDGTPDYILDKVTPQTGAIGLVGPDYPPPWYNPPRGTVPYPYNRFQKAYLYRDGTAKRPVNIRNISYTTESTSPGNFRHNYEIIQSPGAHSNPRAFIENQPSLPALAFKNNTTSSTVIRTILGRYRDEENHFNFIDDYDIGYLTGATNRSIIVTRFSAHGGFETQTRGMQDFRASEFSVYNALNNRYTTVRKPSQGPSGTLSEPHGGTPATARVYDIHGKDYGLISHLARHTAKFGRDSNLVKNPGTSDDESPGFHKLHRNSKQVIISTNEDNTAFATSSRHDNYYVFRPIPRSDRQYRWLSSSTIDVGDIKYCGYQETRRGSMAPYRTSSAGLEPYWNFVTQSDAISGSIFQPANRLNVMVVDPVDRATNTIGHPTGTDMSDYANSELLGLLGDKANTNYLNQLLCKRQSVYGWGWQKTHQLDNKVLTEQRKFNELVLVTDSKKTLSTHRLPPVSMKGRHAIINFDVIDERPRIRSSAPIYNNVTLKATNTNEKIFFNERDLNILMETDHYRNLIRTPAQQILAIAGSTPNRFNWFMYIQNVFPSMRNEFVSMSARRLNYDNLYWRNDNSDRINVGNTVLNSFGISVSQSAWPLDPPIDFLTRTSITVGRGDETASLQTYNLTETQAGELQNTYGSYFTINASGSAGGTGDHTYMKPAALYARKHCLGSPRSVVSPSGPEIAETGSFTGSFTPDEQIETLAGEAIWEAGTQAGVIEKSRSGAVFVPSASNPWWNDYDDFREDLRLKAKGFSVIPEFRMSEHVADYYKYGVMNRSLKDTFEIPGTIFSSSQSDFYKDFSNTDFLEGFLGIQTHKVFRAKEIRLRCEAAIRYNAYKGFYPAQRTLDLVSQFYDSFDNALQVNYVDSDGKPQSLTNKNNFIRDSHGGVVKLVYDKLFSPGILYNSIKSGLAVDYPIVTDPSTMNRTPFGGAISTHPDSYALTIGAPTSSADDGVGYDGGLYWDKRIPFDGIIDPKKYLPGMSFFDMESHPSMSLDSWEYQGAPIRTEVFTASMNENGDEIYNLMARNFFGECSNFFLKNGNLSRLESSTVTNDIKFKKNEVYMARIKLRRSHNGERTYQYDYDSNAVSGASSNYAINGAKVVDQYGNIKKQSYPLPQDPSRNSNFKETFTMYSRPSAFGPPIAGRPSGSRAVSGAFEYAAKDSFEGFNPAFTPPYYDGEAWVDLIFRPTASVAYDLERILSEIQTKTWRFDPGNKIFASDNPATATFTFSDKPNEDTTIALTDTAKTVVTFVIDDAADSNVSGTKVTQIAENGGGATGTAIALAAAINASSLNITAARDGNKVTLTQDTAGVAGNTAITSTLTSGAFSVAVPSAFTSGFDGSARADVPSLIPIERMSDNPDYEGDSPGEDMTIPSIYDGYRLNINSMQLTSSVNIFGVRRIREQTTRSDGTVLGTKNQTVGARWVIQPKWETPMLNFSDEGVHGITAASGTLTLPVYGSASVPRGMWHQFGVIPSDQKTGVFLEIGDIPEQWLKNHYDVLNNKSVYNNNTSSAAETKNLYKRTKSLTTLCGFDNKKTSTKLGELKEKMIVSEAVIAIPYILDEIDTEVASKLKSRSTVKQFSKKFISIPEKIMGEFENEMNAPAPNTDEPYSDNETSDPGYSIRKIIRAMKKYVFPPKFDFLNNKNVKPIAMYVFEFDYEFDKNDLAYMWQNVAPRDYKKLEFKTSTCSHNLAATELISEEILSNNKLRWMVFKVKQRATKDYYSLLADQAGGSTREITEKRRNPKGYKFGFNWPYDYLSFVELIKMDVDVLIKKR